MIDGMPSLPFAAAESFGNFGLKPALEACADCLASMRAFQRAC